MSKHRLLDTAPADLVTQALDDVVTIETEGNPESQAVRLTVRISEARRELQTEVESVRRHYIVQAAASGVALAVAGAVVAGLAFFPDRWIGSGGEVGTVSVSPILAAFATLLAVLVGW